MAKRNPPPIPAMIRDRLHDPAHSSASGDESHLDAELLTLFLERNASASEQDAVMRHLAICAECREIVAVAAPEEALERSSRRHIALSWKLWVSIGGIAVVLLAILLPRMRQPVTPTVKPEMNSIARNTELPAPPPPIPPANRLAAAPAGAAKPVPPDAAPMTPLAAPPEVQIATAQPAAAPATTAPSQAAARAGVVASQPPATSSSTVEVTSSAPLIEANSPQTFAGAPAAAAGNAGGPGGSRGGGGRGIGGAAMARSISSNAALQADDRVSVAPAGNWRLNDAGKLEHQPSAAGPWQVTTLVGDPTLHALANSGSELWVGGMAGVLFHSSDGGHTWVQVRPQSDGLALSDDIQAIAITTAGQVRVTTATGNWSTADSGLHWVFAWN